MEIIVRGKGRVNLGPQDFVCEGGEGKVYIRGNLAFKIFTRQEDVIPEAKIRELANIGDDRVIRPLALIFDNRKKPVGFTMKPVANSIPLARLFSHDFRKANGFCADHAVRLVENLKSVVGNVHKAGCLIVDGNEFNYLVDQKDLTLPYAIDVNSYKTPSFPPSAIMPAIRDFHAKEFSALSDWFSFAVIACRIFLCIHPFRGTHPDYTRKKYQEQLLQKRMENNVSIFNPKVRIPSFVNSFNDIPKNYYEWFICLFEKGKRLCPPDTPGQKPAPAVPVSRNTVLPQARFISKPVKAFEGEILHHACICGKEVTCTRDHVYIEGEKYTRNIDELVFITETLQIPVFVRIRSGRLLMRAPDRDIRYPDILAQGIQIIDNTLFLFTCAKIIQMEIYDINPGILLCAAANAWNILSHSTEMMKGFWIQNTPGSPCLMIPDKKEGCRAKVHSVCVPELKGWRVNEAKHQNKICVLTLFKEGKYARGTIVFENDFNAYHLEFAEISEEDTSVNFTVLENGICVLLNYEGQLCIFNNQIQDHRFRMEDASFLDGARLFSDGLSILYALNHQLFSLAMVSP